MSAVMFGELPPDGRGERWSQAAAAALRERPGEWALVHTMESTNNAGSTAGKIRKGMLRDWQPFGAFEAVARGCDIWARYVGARAARTSVELPRLTPFVDGETP